jgi:hypothetical protein
MSVAVLLTGQVISRQMAWINVLKLNKPDITLPEFNRPETSPASGGPKREVGTLLLKKPDTPTLSTVPPLAELKKPDIRPGSDVTHCSAMNSAD